MTMTTGNTKSQEGDAVSSLSSSDMLVAQAEIMEDTEEYIYCAEAFLLRKVASAASDLHRARHWEEFRKEFPVEKMQDALSEAISAYEKWQADSFSD